MSLQAPAVTSEAAASGERLRYRTRPLSPALTAAGGGAKSRSNARGDEQHALYM